MKPIFAAALLLLVHEPSEPDSTWYNNLQDSQHASCCGNHHDCGTVNTVAPGDEPGSWWALYQGRWVYVPPFVVLERRDNPTRLAVLCVGRDLHGGLFARCFVRPAAEV